MLTRKLNQIYICQIKPNLVLVLAIPWIRNFTFVNMQIQPFMD
jgi:hypothetical protein